LFHAKNAKQLKRIAKYCFTVIYLRSYYDFSGLCVKKIELLYLIFGYIYENFAGMKKHVHLKILTIAFLGLLTIGSFSQTYIPARPYSDPKILQDFLCSEVIYPQDDLKQGIEGEVVIGFVVEKDGSASHVCVKHKVSSGLDAEALRLFSMLLWEPAVSYGQVVASENEFPIDFDIKKYNKHCKLSGYSGKTVLPFQPVDTSNTVYEASKIDKKPYAIFEDKNMNLGKFIATNIKYPETAYRQSLSGKVTLRFVVEPQGRVSNIQVIEPVGGGCTQEAIRLLELINWMPGIKNQTAVRTFMSLDIMFRLQEDSDVKMNDGQQNSN
jgi:TonB family protein